MNTTERNYDLVGVQNDERHLESGDNPEEREGGKVQKPAKGDDKDRHLESGDNPDERGKDR